MDTGLCLHPICQFSEGLRKDTLLAIVGYSSRWKSTESWKVHMGDVSKDQIDTYGLLVILARQGSDEVFERVGWLCELGADPNRRLWETSPIIEALHNFHYSKRLVPLLILYGADINQPVQKQKYSFKTKKYSRKTRYPLDYTRKHWHGHNKYMNRPKMSHFLLSLGAISFKQFKDPELEQKRLHNLLVHQEKLRK